MAKPSFILKRKVTALSNGIGAGTQKLKRTEDAYAVWRFSNRAAPLFKM